MYDSLSKMLKRNGLIHPPSDAPKVGDIRYRNGEAFKILEVDWMNDTLLVQYEDYPPEYCGYYTFCRR